ncbi:MAG: hypothetical protein LBL98_07915 [Ruminococcus sp.]|jgi:rubrerythrin|nr:hypothetical protein [Ruminococcus sp.]
MRLRNKEGKELTEKELEELASGMVIANYYFKCVICGYETPEILPEGQTCPKCTSNWFYLFPISD